MCILVSSVHCSTCLLTEVRVVWILTDVRRYNTAGICHKHHPVTHTSQLDTLSLQYVHILQCKIFYMQWIKTTDKI